MDKNKLYAAYLERWKWRITEEGGKRARNQLANLRRTTTALRKLIEQDELGEICLEGRSSAGGWYQYGLKDFAEWKLWRAQVAETLQRVSRASPAA